MLVEIRGKIRALVGDLGSSKPEIFDFTTSNIFTLGCNNVTSIDSVKINGNALVSGETYDFDSATNELTLIATLTSGDQIEIKYTSNKYSDTELDKFIEAGLVYISIFADNTDDDFEIENDEIYPTPDNKEEDLISLISSILIKPDYSSYKLPNVTVTYPRNMSKEERITQLVVRFYRGNGLSGELNWEVY